MAVQKSKVSRSHRDHRRAQAKVSKPTLAEDSLTGETHRRHHITEGGFYRGKHVVDLVGENLIDADN